MLERYPENLHSTLAWHPGTSPDLLMELAVKSTDMLVTALLANNPTTPPEALRYLYGLTLITGGVPHSRDLAAVNTLHHANFPQDLMRQVWHEGVQENRMKILVNPACPREFIEEAIMGDNQYERHWAAKRSDWTDEELAEFTKDPYLRVREVASERLAHRYPKSKDPNNTHWVAQLLREMNFNWKAWKKSGWEDKFVLDF